MASDRVATVEEPVFEVGIDEKVPLNQLVILAFQNIFGMTGMFVFPGLFGRAFQMSPEQIAYLYGMIFLVSGLTTCFQGVGFLRLPIVQGPYVGSFIGLMVLGHLPGMGLDVAFGSLFVACLIWAALTIPIRGFSVLALFGHFFQAPMIAGLMVLLAMMQIAEVSLPNWIGHPGTPGFMMTNVLSGFVAVVTFMAMTIFGGRWLRRAAILSGLILGTIFYALFIPISFAPVSAAPWLVVPKIFPFGFAVRADAVLVFLVALIPASISCMPFYKVVATWGNQEISPTRMSEGCFAAALGSIIGAMVGTFSMFVYPDNIGMARATRVGSRYATFAAGVLLVLLGSNVKFDMLLVLVPVVVLGGIATVLFGIVLVHGIHLLADVKWSDRNLIIAGASLMVGLGGLFVSPEVLKQMPLVLQLVFKQSAITGGVTLLVLYALLGQDKVPAEPEDENRAERVSSASR